MLLVKRVKLCTLILLACGMLHAQPVKKIGYLWDPNNKTYKKAVSIPGGYMVLSLGKTPRIVTSHKMIWILPTQQVPGHWRRAKVGEIEERSKLKAEYLYPISIEGYPTYPNGGNAPKKTFDLNSIVEEKKLLDKAEIPYEGFIGQKGRTNVYYINKVNLGLLTFAREQDNILVTDTLYIPAAKKLSNSIACINQAGRPYVKVVANYIEYESPATINLMGREAGDFVFSAEKIAFRSIYQGLQNYEIKPAPPLFVAAEGTTNYLFRDYFSSNEAVLINRLFINIMQQCFNKLNTTNDEWIKDKLVEQFQVCRYVKLRSAYLDRDPQYQNLLNALIKDFDVAYKDYRIKRVREVGTTVVLVDGDVNEIPLKPLKYYVLPSSAQLLPLLKEGTRALGLVHYSPIRDADLKMQIEVELGYDQTELARVTQELSSKSVTIESKLPAALQAVKEQPFVFNGKTIGKIVPISNRLLRLDIGLPEGSKSIADLFPKIGNVSFKVDFTINEQQKVYTRDITLNIEKALLDNLDYTAPLKSFDISEKTELTSNVKVSSNLNSTRTNEGALNYIEILLEFKFPNKTLLRGPFRFSSYNTLASEAIIPYLKYASDFMITVSGRALYENGERSLTPFETKNEIIILDEAAFNPK